MKKYVMSSTLPGFTLMARKPLIIIELPVSISDTYRATLDEKLKKIRKDYHVLVTDGKGTKMKYIVVGDTMQTFDSEILDK